MTGVEKHTPWDQVRKLYFDLDECIREQATLEAIEVVGEISVLLMKQLDQEAKDATDRSLSRLSEMVEAKKFASEAVTVLSDILSALKEDAPGTKLNNHKYDQLGIRAYSVIERQAKATQSKP